MSCGCAGHGADCTCCQGVTAITPMEITNRPGLDALRYRVGTHARFFETMQAKLSSAALEVENFDDEGQRSTTTIRPLEGLTTRERSDPAIAVLDAWATVADVLSFYTERVANEGYLRTATERRSVLEIARLVGYAPRPGVAASVYLAYTLEDGHEDVTLKAGTRAQSVPAPGELPQSFETSEDFVAQARLSAIRPRLTRPQFRTPDASMTLYLKGIVSALKVGDRLRLIFEQADASGQTSFAYRVNEVTLEPERDRTTVALEAIVKAAQPADARVITVVKSPLEMLRALQIPGASKVATAVKTQLEALRADDGARLLSGARGALSTVNAQIGLVGNNPKLNDALFKTALHLETFAAANDALETPGATSDPTRREASARAAIAHLETVRATAEAAGQAELATYAASAAAAAKNQFVTPSVTEILGPLLLEPSRQVPSSAFLAKNPEKLLRPRDDMATRAFLRVFPRAKDTAYSVLEAAPPVTRPSLSGVERFQVAAGVYGHNAPLTPVLGINPDDDSQRIVTGFRDPPGFDDFYLNSDDPESGKTLLLDAQYDSIKPGSWIAIVSSVVKKPAQFRQVVNIESASPRLYGLSSTITKLTLNQPWPSDTDDPRLTVGDIVKSTTIFAATDTTITLTDEPIEGRQNDVGGANGVDADGQVSELELNGLYRGLEPGRWVIVQGERAFETLDDEGKFTGELTPSGVVVAELAMVAEVRHDVSTIIVNGKARNLPGDTLHTFVRLARPLKWRFKRETITVFGNVIKSTHGETRAEVLGAGDAAKVFQRFELKQPPLTYLAAPTAVGAASTLEVRVDGLKWLEAAHLAGLGRTDRRYTLRTDDDGKTSVVFGDGVRGARLPTGRENITASYRNGIGKPGNVGANRISLLASRPLGVKGVINPIRASGGADRESRDQARRNAPLAVMALDRLVSVQDYEDFARTFAGIGKASAARFNRGGRALVYLTIAGADDIPIEVDSDLYRNLLEALRQNGDADQPVNLDVRDLRLLVVSARVRIRPEYAWDRVEASLRQRMLEHFGFDRRELGQDVTSSEVLAVIQAAPGVEYADLGSVTDNRGLGWIDGEQFARLEGENPPDSLIQWVPDTPPGDARVVAEIARPKDPTRNDSPSLPAQLVTLSPDVPATLILTEIK